MNIEKTGKIVPGEHYGFIQKSRIYFSQSDMEELGADPNETEHLISLTIKLLKK